MHAHILESFEELVDLTMYYDYSLGFYLEKGSEYSSKSIDAGFTTVRNLAVYYGWADRELRDQINRGEVVGPRLQPGSGWLPMPTVRSR